MHKIGSSQRLLRCLATLTLLASLPSMAAATTLPDVPQDQWRWFEVEVLVFKHSADETVTEAFPWQGPQAAKDAAYSPLVDYYVPDITGALAGLPRCAPPPLTLEFSAESIWCVAPHELDPLLPQNWQRRQAMLASLPRAPEKVIDGVGGAVSDASSPFLAPASQLELAEMRQQIIRRGVGVPLLHMSWYQPVFELDDDFKVRLFGGENYGERFAPSGYLYSETEQTPERLTTTLSDRLARLFEQQQAGRLTFKARADDQPIAPPPLIERPADAPAVWELDGTVHIYLVGNYLHIASDLELREPQSVSWQPATLAAQAERALQPRSDGQFLRSFKLDQLRRVISHETHYFDHPKLGIAVQIRRTDLSARRY